MSQENIYILSFAALLWLFLPMTANTHEISAPAVADRMVQTANSLLDTLTSEQRDIILFPFEDNERFDWHYVPRSRAGLSLKDMNENQRKAAMDFLKAGLSRIGYDKATTIMSLEAVLREIETWNWLGRDPDKYYFSFFGRPSETDTWGWRVEGHHLSLNFTIVEGRLFATAPRFLGANPAKVPDGKLQGLRTLAEEEDLARRLVKSMKRQQLKKTVFRKEAYRDIVTGSDREVAPLEPVGISWGELNQPQKDLMINLIDVYLASMPAEIAQQRLDAIRRDGLDTVHFGWAGGLEPGQPHYYRIQGTAFLIEYDNVQNGANHIHTVWRDFDGDFGRDLLQEHYRADHQQVSE